MEPRKRANVAVLIRAVGRRIASATLTLEPVSPARAELTKPSQIIIVPGDEWAH